MIRVVGLASTVLYDKSDPHGAINRRISIVILNKRTEEAILRDGKAADVETADEALQAAAAPALAAESSQR